MRRAAAALVVYVLIWGLVVEGFDAATGDPFAPEDMLTHAFTVALAILLWPLFRRAWRVE